MTHDETCSPVIERLVAALVDDQRAVELDANVLPGRVNWSFRVDVNDAGKVIGRNGTHLRALQLVIERMGAATNEEWRTASQDPVGLERARRPYAEEPRNHDAGDDWKLLCEVLVALGINATVTPTGSIADGYNFQVRGDGVQDHEALLDAHEAIYSRNQKERDPLNVLGALGTLFRAIGRRQGVRYRIETPLP